MCTNTSTSNAAAALHLIAWQVTELLQAIKKIRVTNNDATATIRADVCQTTVSVNDQSGHGCNRGESIHVTLPQRHPTMAESTIKHRQKTPHQIQVVNVASIGPEK
jgi:hypothetical protein